MKFMDIRRTRSTRLLASAVRGSPYDRAVLDGRSNKYTCFSVSDSLNPPDIFLMKPNTVNALQVALSVRAQRDGVKVNNDYFQIQNILLDNLHYY